MIDANCHIWKSGKGFCKVPASGWNMTEEQLCKACMLKHLVCRYCGRNENNAHECEQENCKQTPIRLRLVKSA